MGVSNPSVLLDPGIRRATSAPVRLMASSSGLYAKGGTGYLAGAGADGVTRVEGVPAPATVRVLLRSPMPALDGALVAEVRSNVDGTWRVDELDTRLKYDVVCRGGDDYNDMIFSNVSPATH